MEIVIIKTKRIIKCLIGIAVSHFGGRENFKDADIGLL
jgi:hypothetical protein